MDNYSQPAESEQHEIKRDLLDIMESYKYMNAFFYNNENIGDGRWDYATGWVELNMNKEEWRIRARHK